MLKENGVYIDGTFGRGGHSRLILSKLSPNGRLIGIDRDPRAIAEAQKIQDPRFQIEHNSFSHIPEICEKLGLVGKIDGILLDLGVSSPQLDEAERGFSFMQDGYDARLVRCRVAETGLLRRFDLGAKDLR